jgi:CBS domain-containing protein
MKVQDAMTRNVTTCNQDDTLSHAARLMWEYDCGGIPVLNQDGAVCGMITDRDICMAAYTRGLPLQELQVRNAMSAVVHTCQPEDSIESALQLMHRNRVRRIPVTDGGRPVGMLSLSDLMTVLRSSDRGREAPSAETLVDTLSHISERHYATHHVHGNGARDGHTRAIA